MKLSTDDIILTKKPFSYAELKDGEEITLTEWLDRAESIIEGIIND